MLAVKQQNLDAAHALIDKAVRAGGVLGASLHVEQGGTVFRRAYGAARNPDAVFLLASITQPMTTTAVMILSDRGRLNINDPVSRYLPEFRGDGRDAVTLKHLLTHTSGLPDMVPQNIELRKRHAPLSEFTAATLRVPLLFPPGREVRYQSMGILLLAGIVERVSQMPLREFLRREVFQPLDMTRTSLGLGGRKVADLVPCQVPEKTPYDWNTNYWRDLGAPWGGAHSSASDVARFLLLPTRRDGKVLKPETAAAMVTNHTAGMKEAWGLGWMLGGARFGTGCSEATFGHYGATGTVAWHDPRSGLRCVLLTTKPADQSRAGLLGPVSDLVSQPNA